MRSSSGTTSAGLDSFSSSSVVSRCLPTRKASAAMSATRGRADGRSPSLSFGARSSRSASSDVEADALKIVEQHHACETAACIAGSSR